MSFFQIVGSQYFPTKKGNTWLETDNLKFISNCPISIFSHQKRKCISRNSQLEIDVIYFKLSDFNILQPKKKMHKLEINVIFSHCPISTFSTKRNAWLEKKCLLSRKKIYFPFFIGRPVLIGENVKEICMWFIKDIVYLISFSTLPWNVSFIAHKKWQIGAINKFGLKVN